MIWVMLLRGSSLDIFIFLYYVVFSLLREGITVMFDLSKYQPLMVYVVLQCSLKDSFLLMVPRLRFFVVWDPSAERKVLN
jgi:hypothetical protein